MIVSNTSFPTNGSNGLSGSNESSSHSHVHSNSSGSTPKRPKFKISLTIWIFIGLFIGIAFGYFAPSEWSVALKPIGKLFIRLIKMIVAPLVFSSLIVGLAGAGKGQEIRESISQIISQKDEITLQIRSLEQERDIDIPQIQKQLEAKELEIKAKEKELRKSIKSIFVENEKIIAQMDYAKMLASVPSYLELTKITESEDAPSVLLRDALKKESEEFNEAIKKQKQLSELSNNIRMEQLYLNTADSTVVRIATMSKIHELELEQTNLQKDFDFNFDESLNKIKELTISLINKKLLIEQNKLLEKEQAPVLKEIEKLKQKREENLKSLSSAASTLSEKTISQQQQEQQQSKLTTDKQKYNELIELIKILEQRLSDLTTITNKNKPCTSSVVSISPSDSASNAVSDDMLTLKEALHIGSIVDVTNTAEVAEEVDAPKTMPIIETPTKTLLQTFTGDNGGAISIFKESYSDSSNNTILISISSNKLPSLQVQYSIKESDYNKALKLTKKDTHFEIDRSEYSLNADFTYRFARSDKINIDIKRKVDPSSSRDAIPPALTLSIFGDVLHSATVTYGKHPAVKIKDLKKK